MTGLEELTKCIIKLSADAVNTLLDAVKMLLASQNTTGIPDCPYCSSTKAIRYGHKCGKQRFLCKAGLFADYIAQGALVLCDGLKGYHSLSAVTGCTVKDCHGLTENPFTTSSRLL